MQTFAAAGALTSLLLASTANALTPIEVQGSDFVNSQNGDRFKLLGVDYQPGGSSGFTTTQDPLSNGTQCLRDAALMQKLGSNAIRVYNLDPNLNHDECASVFNAAGIYMVLDVNSPLDGGSLNRDDPASSYTSSYLEHIFGVVEAFKNYPNTAAFFAGNEIINSDANAQTVPPYIRVR